MLLVIGTSGLVHPAAGLPGPVKQRGACVVEINPVASALSDEADVCLRMAATRLTALLEP